MATDKNKQVFDVAKPGQTPPSSTSKPVIVGHGPILQDPMVNKDEPKKTASEESKPAAPRGKKIVPISDAKSDKKEEAAAPDEEKVSDSDTQKSSDEAAVDVLANEAAKPKKDAQSEEDKRRQDELEKMIEDKKYFVPIGEVTRRKNTRKFLITAVILIIFLAAGGYLAIDAGLLQAPFDLPYEFIEG